MTVWVPIYLFLVKGCYLNSGKRQKEKKKGKERESTKANYVLDSDLIRRKTNGSMFLEQ
jgi:hypothetical protein